MTLSEKGKNWKGDELSDENLHADVVVQWRNRPYNTGNRRHFEVELYVGFKFIRTVNMKSIQLIKP